MDIFRLDLLPPVLVHHLVGGVLLVIEGPPAKVEDIPLVVAKDLVDGLRVAVLSGLDGLVGDPTITLNTPPPGAPAKPPGLSCGVS